MEIPARHGQPIGPATGRHEQGVVGQLLACVRDDGALRDADVRDARLQTQIDADLLVALAVAHQHLRLGSL